jgi:hypothetical protein
MYVLIIMLVNSLLSTKNFENYPVDVYGTSQEESHKILNEYAKRVNDISEYFVLNLQKFHDKRKFDPIKVNEDKYENLINEIKRKYNFIYVNFSIVIYLNGKHNYFTTIEVIKPNNPNRMRFIQQTNKNETSKSNKHTADTADIIEIMRQYHETEAELLKNKKLHPLKGNCPAYHCTPGFAHPTLKHYLSLFNIRAVKEKSLILRTLRNDPSEARRAAAVFLIGHLSNPKEVISLLLPFIMDKSNYVRNNVMLIIATTMGVEGIHQIDTKPFLNFLDSPYATDRNKALGILLEATTSPVEKRIVVERGGEKLINLLLLKQPNNHELAYLILKKISGKDYGEYDISAWRNWLVHAKDSGS